MTIIQKDIEAILWECVGEDTPNSSAELLGFKAYLRGTVPETARKVLGMVEKKVLEENLGILEWVSLILSYKHVDKVKELINIEIEDHKNDIASLAGEDEGDNVKEV